MDKPDIDAMLDLAASYVLLNRSGTAQRDMLRGRTLINLFFEDSTRTRTSFELAGKRLGADVINMSVANSSVNKGETLLDTAATLNAMNCDLLVVRHAQSGAPSLLAQKVDAAVINAGDGTHEHPTQALLDALTIRRRKGRLEGLIVAICGDVLHSRVARSNIHLLTTMGSQVRVIGPPTLIPTDVAAMGVEVFHDMRKGLQNADIVMMLRLQKERMTGGLVPSAREFFRFYGLDADKLAYWLPAPVAVRDAPKFSYRGIMVDPARQFLPPAVLRQLIDSLTVVKLNVLHVHVLDCDSFSVQVAPPFERLWEGAFSPSERYTALELAALSEYGRARGVSVVYEFDQPGHMGAMCRGYPALCPQPACSPAYGGDVLDPSFPGTVPAMQAVVDALVAASNSSILHLGGDEVNPACWLASPSVRQWMAEHNMTTGDDVYEYFVLLSNAMAVAAGKAPMRWEEVWKHFGTALHRDTIVHAWLSSDAMFQAASAGYRTVFSVNSAAYYLDYLDVLWSQVYEVDPLAGLTNASSLPFILGGEMCMWGETVDAASLLSVIWPRAAAAAERLWSYNFAAVPSA